MDISFHSFSLQLTYIVVRNAKKPACISVKLLKWPIHRVVDLSIRFFQLNENDLNYVNFPIFIDGTLWWNLY